MIYMYLNHLFALFVGPTGARGPSGMLMFDLFLYLLIEKSRCILTTIY